MSPQSPQEAPRSRPARTAIALSLLLPACASYPQRTAEAFDAFRSGQMDRALEQYSSTECTGSEFLSGAEAGTAALAAGRWEDARALFDRAAAETRDLEERALISATGSAEWLGTLAFNETARTYEGEGFERVYLHAGLALAWLGLGSAEDALVEARRANELLESEEELYEKDYRAGGFGHLLSALAYELAGEPGDAWIDYQRMLDKGSGEELAGRAQLRLARVLGREEQVEELAQRFGPDPGRPVDAASVVLLAGVGLGPFKQEVRLDIPTFDGFLSWAVPDYVNRPQPVEFLRLAASEAGGEAITVRSAVVEDVAAVARENLADRIAWMAAKSAGRAVLKRELTQQLEKQHGDLGLIAGDLFSIATERADLRCWQTLPNSWQAGRLFLPPGRWELSLEASGAEQSWLGAFELRPNETVFVIARTVDRRLLAHVVGGLAIEDLEAPPDAEATDPDAIRTLQQLLEIDEAAPPATP